jgi:hypothetical protein
VRWVALVITGCAASVPPPATPEFARVPPPPPTAFQQRLATLRATLARSHVELDRTAVPSRCEIADDDPGVDPDMVDAVSLAFARYPSSVLAAAHLEHVVLCRKLHVAHGEEPAGLASSGEHRVMISVDLAYRGEFQIEQVVHHELFHLIDYATNPHVEDDAPWHALNPPHFAYRDPAPDSPVRPRGFVNSYATTSEVEDRASVFEYLMGQPDELCAFAAADPLVAAKAKLVRDRVVKLIGDKRLPHCDRKAAKVPLVTRPPSLMGKMR